jgi:hypothetical protein
LSVVTIRDRDIIGRGGSNPTTLGDRSLRIPSALATIARCRPRHRESRNMTEADYGRMLAELDRLLNDPDVPMQPARVWSLLAEILQRDHRAGAPASLMISEERSSSSAP